MKVIEKIAWIHIVNRRILSTRSHGKNVYYIPGGKREENESDIEALIREIKEELTVELLPDSIRYVDTFEAQADGKPEGVIVKMICYIGSYKGQLHANSEIEEVVWLTYRERHKCSPVDKIIFKRLYDQGKIIS